MRRALLACSTATFLLAPMIASAAFQQPRDLFTGLQSDTNARSFSIEAHGGSNGTYVSFWGKGSEQTSADGDMELSMNATVDVSQDGMKARIKGEIMITDGLMFLKIKSAEGSHKDAITPFIDLAKMNQWIEISADNDMLTEVTGTDIGMLSATDPLQADEMFTMTSVSGKNGSTYTLTLTSDFAATMAQKLRQMLSDTDPVSTDFFPWRELAQSIQFNMKVSTDAAAKFESSAFSMSMSGKNSYFRASGTEKALASGLSLTAPEDAVQIGDVLSSFGGMNYGELPSSGPAMMQSSPGMMQDEGDADMSSDAAAADASACTNGSVSAQALMMMQRTGACPTSRVPTRYEH